MVGVDTNLHLIVILDSSSQKQNSIRHVFVLHGFSIDRIYIGCLYWFTPSYGNNTC